jgi:hypothetical protein
MQFILVIPIQMINLQVASKWFLSQLQRNFQCVDKTRWKQLKKWKYYYFTVDQAEHEFWMFWWLFSKWRNWTIYYDQLDSYYGDKQMTRRFGQRNILWKKSNKLNKTLNLSKRQFLFIWDNLEAEF